MDDELDTERTTVHVSDREKNIAFIDSLTVDAGVELTTPTDTIRYQYDNHLGSSCLELDENGATISYEEYHPFGTSSYRLHRNSTEASLKRYRYVGKERDEETGLYYYGARYYAAWIARWTAVDPMTARRIWLTPYNYCQNNPINVSDPTGALDDGGEKAAQRKKRISTRSSNTPTYTAPSFDNTDNTRVAEGKIPTIEDLNTKPAVVKKQENKQKEAFIGPCDRHLYDPDFLAANKRKWEWEKMKADFMQEGMAKNPVSFGGGDFGMGANRGIIEGFKQAPAVIIPELVIARISKIAKLNKLKKFEKAVNTESAVSKEAGLTKRATNSSVNGAIKKSGELSLEGTIKGGGELSIESTTNFSDEFFSWLTKGEANNSVYFGIENGEAVYTGITRQELAKRLYQHNYNGKNFEQLSVKFDNLTRNQARAVEQYLIEYGSASEQNIANSISPNSEFYNDAMKWAKDFIHN